MPLMVWCDLTLSSLLEVPETHWGGRDLDLGGQLSQVPCRYPHGDNVVDDCQEMYR